MKALKKLGAGLAALMAMSAGNAHAGLAQWSSNNIEYLYGTHYNQIGADGHDTRSIVTIEHVDAWKYGDNFFFVDITNADRQGKLGSNGSGGEFATYYGELSPRLSFGKITGKDLSFGIFKDFLFTATLEMPTATVVQLGGATNNLLLQNEQTYLYGLATDLKLPGFAYFQVNLYRRDNQSSAVGAGGQLTLVWGAPFSIGPAKMMFEGFFDYAFSESGLHDNIITAPRLLVDAGDFFGAPGTVQVGCEWQIWRNQFGIKDENESVPQAMVKVIFN
ncbi:Nucleoside-specific outer membrane channel protein Tsx [Solimonas aquatica]|uniref:Nucleoside-specific outer membrane channel protein Tsx n=1 Tax=Solimonas aquatica TaxID=489703 RepID=A0A1H9IH27_9GAMM|nr:outer membrane protein OmpK [Solimonas aquatica]SEQ73695.1 Nucleoside-specific outer membrane channel protein Tsx [Solimonas aquatica]